MMPVMMMPVMIMAVMMMPAMIMAVMMMPAMIMAVMMIAIPCLFLGPVGMRPTAWSREEEVGDMCNPLYFYALHSTVFLCLQHNAFLA